MPDWLRATGRAIDRFAGSLNRYAVPILLAVTAAMGILLAYSIFGKASHDEVARAVAGVARRAAAENRSFQHVAALNTCGGRNLDHAAFIGTLEDLSVGTPDTPAKARAFAIVHRRYPQYACDVFAATGKYVLAHSQRPPSTKPGAPGVPVPRGQAKPPAPAPLPGPAGPAGTPGATGPRGPRGAQGPRGARGPRGPIGPAGLQGAQGPEGATGAEGAQGPRGEQGPRGPAGDDANLDPVLAALTQARTERQALAEALAGLNAIVADQAQQIAALRAQLAASPPPPAGP